MLLLQEAGGGVFGILRGYVTYRLPGSIDSDQEQVPVTPAAAIGSDALAMSDETRGPVDSFWELLDSILNAVLCLLIGLEMIVVRMSPMLGVAALITIAVTLFAPAINDRIDTQNPACEHPAPSGAPSNGVASDCPSMPSCTAGAKKKPLKSEA
ncbi:hypothetical protein [Massilia pseudoviolaceinigra]|uniref:hypothetical protein n=1 Tax=Massilia pseudoviolaceinigra TaxID=3057165 RepID=UPI002796D622|nr:hypothetical protein [Massilia sp. CCM 9206]MDQ1919167.1 hypothetical protein [Massilia sp. CCM 9206]